jgi:hypothetical protein
MFETPVCGCLSKSLKPLKRRRCNILHTRCDLLRNLTQIYLIGSRLSSVK